MSDFLAGIPLVDGVWRREGRWWIHPDGTRVPVIAGGTNTFGITQAAYRFYNDNGSESTATVAANENAAVTAPVFAGNKPYHLRIRYDETGTGSANGLATDDYQLQVSKNGAAFANVTTTSSNVKAVDSANLTNDGATTARLTAGGGSFIAGEVSEDGLVDNWQLTADNYSEHVFAIEVVSADVAHNDSLTFRTLRNGATTGFVYTVTPTITVDKQPIASPPVGSASLAGTVAVLGLGLGLVTGALALAGQTVGVAFQGPLTGTLAVTGQAPALNIGPVVQIPSGTLTAEGQAPTVQIQGSTILVVPEAPLTISGQTPTLAIDARLALPAGTALLTGETVTLQSGMPVESASALLTGQTVTLQYDQPIGSATALLTGETVTLKYQSPIGAAAAVLMGELPTPVVSGGTNTTIAVPVGPLTAVGQLPTLAFEERLSLPQGTLGLSGHAPALQIGILVPVGAGALTASGTSAVLSLTVPLSAGSLVGSGQTPALSQGLGVPIPAASGVWAGTTPALVEGTGRVPGDAALTLQGQVPVASVAYALSIPAGSAIWTGTVPIISGDSVESPDAAALSFTGTVPAPTIFAPVPSMIRVTTVQGLSSTLTAITAQQASLVDLTAEDATLTIRTVEYA